MEFKLSLRTLTVETPSGKTCVVLKQPPLAKVCVVLRPELLKLTFPVDLSLIQKRVVAVLVIHVCA